MRDRLLTRVAVLAVVVAAVSVTHLGARLSSAQRAPRLGACSHFSDTLLDIAGQAAAPATTPASIAGGVPRLRYQFTNAMGNILRSARLEEADEAKKTKPQ